MSSHIRTITQLPAAVLLAISSSNSFAQEDTGALNRGQGLLEEITVTAKKTATSLQDTPLSISAFSAEQLQRVGAVNNYDVALLTPNFNTNQQLGRRLDRPVVRGQSGPAVGGEPNASYFIDGVFVSGSISSATLGPIERVEILRGPQSAQFGRATFAGAINYVTRQPTDEFESEVRAVGASNETLQVNGWASGPIIADTLRFFVAGGYDSYGGEWRNDLKDGQTDPSGWLSVPTEGDNSDLGGTETIDLATKFDWLIGDSTKLTLKGSYTKAKDDHYMQWIQEPGELNCYLPTDGTNGTIDNTGEYWYNTSEGMFCGEIDEKRVNYNEFNPWNGPYIPGAPEQGGARQARFNLNDFREGTVLFFDTPFTTGQPARPGAERDQFRTYLQLDQDIGEWSLMGRIAYNNDDFLTAYDLDQREERPLGGLFHLVESREVEDKSFELILRSPADYRLRGSLGTYLFDSEMSRTQRRMPGLACVTGVTCGTGLWEDPPLIDNIENTSIFGTLDFDIIEDLTFSAEVRWAKDEKTIVSGYTCTEEDDPNNDYPQFYGQRVEDAASSKALTPRFTLNWRATEDAMLYALAAKGNKPAEFNAGYFRVNANPCESLQAREDGLTQTKEETAWTYEGGTKTTWMDGRALLNASVFWIEWTNQATFTTVDIGGVPTQSLENAGRSEVFGVEIESSFAFTDNFTGSLSYGLADGKYKRYNSTEIANTTGEGLAPDGGLEVGANNAKGNQLPFSPVHSIIGSLDYARGIRGDLGWFARTDAVWESRKYTGASNFAYLSDRTIWNGRLGIGSSRWTLTGYVSNILDDTTPSSGPSFIYFFGNSGGISWDKGANCNNNTTPCSNLVQTAAYAASRGRQYGLDFVFRFGARAQ